MALPVWHVAGIGDFDGNGRSDILFVNDNGVFALWRTDAAASFPRPCRSAISARNGT